MVKYPNPCPHNPGTGLGEDVSPCNCGFSYLLMFVSRCDFFHKLFLGVNIKLDLPGIGLWLNTLQGDHSAFDKPPVDIKTKLSFWPGLVGPGQAKKKLLFWSQRDPVDFKIKVSFWPGQARPGQAKMKVLFWCQREVCQKLNGHPVEYLITTRFQANPTLC